MFPTRYEFGIENFKCQSFIFKNLCVRSCTKECIEYKIVGTSSKSSIVVPILCNKKETFQNVIYQS